LQTRIKQIILTVGSFGNFQNNRLRSCKIPQINAILMGLATAYFQAV
jgi:hypothetical protein